MFFVEGYETSSVALSFLLYNLAINRDVQEKVREEIKEALKKNKGQLTFESISTDFPYLHCVTLGMKNFIFRFTEMVKELECHN